MSIGELCSNVTWGANESGDITATTSTFSQRQHSSDVGRHAQGRFWCRPQSSIPRWPWLKVRLVILVCSRQYFDDLDSRSDWSFLCAQQWLGWHLHSHPFSQNVQRKKDNKTWQWMRVVDDWSYDDYMITLSLIHIWRCRRIERCRSRWSPYH